MTRPTRQQSTPNSTASSVRFRRNWTEGRRYLGIDVLDRCNPTPADTPQEATTTPGPALTA